MLSHAHCADGLDHCCAWARRRLAQRIHCTAHHQRRVVGCPKHLQQQWHSRVAGRPEAVGARSTRGLVRLAAESINQRAESRRAAARAEAVGRAHAQPFISRLRAGQNRLSQSIHIDITSERLRFVGCGRTAKMPTPNGLADRCGVWRCEPRPPRQPTSC